jgi:hypothetical protein
MNKTEGVIDKGGELLDGVRRVWPLSSVMEPAEPERFIRRDSHE